MDNKDKVVELPLGVTTGRFSGNVEHESAKPKAVLNINANIPTKELEKLREKYPKNSVDEVFEIK